MVSSVWSRTGHMVGPFFGGPLSILFSKRGHLVEYGGRWRFNMRTHIKTWKKFSVSGGASMYIITI